MINPAQKEPCHLSGWMAKKNAHTLSTSLLLAVFSFVLLTFGPWPNVLDRYFQDGLIKKRAALHKPSEEIIVIDIDDTSLSALAPVVGKWPWPRSVHAELLEYILAHNPRAVIFDILFSEEDRFRPDGDRYFEEVIASQNNVYLAALEQTLVNPAQAPLLASYPANAGIEKHPGASIAQRAQLLLPKAISNDFWRLGLINLTADDDGRSRRYKLYHDWQGWRMPTMAAKVVSDLSVELPNTASIHIAWAGADAVSFSRLSFATLLSQARGEQHAVPKELLQNRIIIIGSTASGLHDLRDTPISSFHPGSFILASALDNLLNGEQLAPPHKIASFTVGLFLLAFCYLLLTRLSLVPALCGSVTAMIALVIYSAYSLIQHDRIFLTTPILCSILILLTASVLTIHSKNRARYQTLINKFKNLVDPEVVKQILETDNPESLLASKNCKITVLFSDIRGFTQLSESRAPTEVVNLLNRYFELQLSTLFEHKATLDKFIGDAVMAFWGAPIDCDNQAELAIAAALDMIDNLESFKQQYAYKNFDIGIGIHTGDAVVGMVGTPQRYDYTAIGDSVNVASRVEGLTKNRATLLVSESTMLETKSLFEFTHCGEFQVKGRSEPVNVYEVNRRE